MKRKSVMKQIKKNIVPIMLDLICQYELSWNKK